MTEEQDQREGPKRLPRTLLAVAAAWVFPGLGHVVLGRFRRGLLFAAIVLGGYVLGLTHQGRMALRDERQPFLSTLQVVANVGIGPTDLVARLKGIRGGIDNDHSRTFRDRARSSLSIYGTAYLWTAGLMNLLLLFDVWDIGMARKP